MTTAAVAAPGRRPGLLAGSQQALTLTWRSVLKIRTSLEDVFGLSLTPIVFLLLFTYVFGGALAGSSHAYLQYALPGILVYTVVLATLDPVRRRALPQLLQPDGHPGGMFRLGQAGQRGPAPQPEREIVRRDRLGSISSRG